MQCLDIDKQREFFRNEINFKEEFQNSKCYLNILQKQYGSYSYHTLQAIKLFTSNFSQFAADLIQNLNILKYSQQEQTLTSLSQQLMIFFVQEKGLDSVALISLINDALTYQIQNSKVVKQYGLKKQDSEKLNLMATKIIKINEAIPLQLRQSKWEEAKKLIHQISPKILSESKLQYQNIRIESPQQLYDIWNKLKIPRKDNELSLSQLYEAVNCLGVQHSKCMEMINSITFPAYIDKVTLLLKGITPASIQLKIDRQLLHLFNYLKEQKYADAYYIQKFEQIIADYYQHGGQLTSLSPSRIASIDCKVCQTLKGLISPQKQPFKQQLVETIKKTASTIKSQYSEIEPSMYINEMEHLNPRGRGPSQLSLDPIGLLKDLCGLQIPALDSIEIIRYPSSRPNNKHSFTCEGGWTKEHQYRLPQSSIGRSNNGFTESLSMQHSIGEIIKHMSKNSNMNRMCQAQADHKKKPALNSLVQEQSEIQLTKKSSKNSFRHSEKFISIGDKYKNHNPEHFLINPFTLAEENQSHRNVNFQVFLVFISREQMGKMDLKRIYMGNGKQKIVSLDVAFTHRRYKSFHVMYASFQAPDARSKYSLVMHHNLLSKIRKQQYKIDIQIQENNIYNGHYFMISIEQILEAITSQEQVHEAIHFSLFSGIKFVAKNLIAQKKFPQQIMYTYLKLFFDHYRDYSPQLLSEIIGQLYISKSVSIVQSKYTIYFLYVLFLQNSLGIYFNSDLYKKVKFEKNYVFTAPPEIYSSLIILEEFYNVTQIINAFIHYRKQTAFLINSLCLSIMNQRQENIYLILNIVTYFAPPPVLQALQHQLIRQLYNNPYLTAVEYINVRMVSLINNLQLTLQNYVKNVRIINTFLQDLIIISRNKKINTKRKVEYPCRCQIQKFIMTIPHKEAPVNWIIFISKLKDLYQASEGHINLIQSVQTSYSFFLDRNLLVDYLKVLVRKPLLRFEKKETVKIIKKSSFDQSKMKALIFELLKQNTLKYDLQIVQEVLDFFLKSRYLKQEQVEIMLMNLDKSSQSIKNVGILKFLLFVFKKYAFEALIPENALNQETFRVNKIESYKQYLKIVKHEEYRVTLMEKILKQIRQQEKDFGIKQLSWEIYPNDSPQDCNERKALDTIYRKIPIIRSEVLHLAPGPQRAFSQIPVSEPRVTR